MLQEHRSVLTFVAIAVLFTATVASAQRKEPKKTEIRGHTMYTLLDAGDIPAVFEPDFMTFDEADEVYYDDEPLIVVAAGDEARGYSTWHLDRHEVVNDYINGKAITVTW